MADALQAQVPVGREQHVVGGEVAMHDVLGVDVLHATGHVDEGMQDLMLGGEGVGKEGKGRGRVIEIHARCAWSGWLHAAGHVDEGLEDLVLGKRGRREGQQEKKM